MKKLNKTPASPMKMVKEKATGETYASKSAMKKHEKGESKATQKKEVKKSPMHQSKVVIDTMMREKKTSPTKMKKC
jgi:hypothetical protein